MPEGDTLYRTAEVLRRTLGDGVVTSARGRAGGARLDRVVGSGVAGIETTGKHLLIHFEAGLTLHTHLGMKGSWHRYRPGERWRRDPSGAVAVIETATGVAACFDAPTVELLDRRALHLHPALAGLGPDLLVEPPDLAAIISRLRTTERQDLSVAEGIVEQSAVAGLGNVYRSELLFIERLDPFMRLADLADADLERVLRTGARLLRANLEGGDRVTMLGADGALGSRSPGRDKPRWVYRRAGLPCRRCGTTVRSASMGRLLRRLYWCPSCQAPRREH